MYCCILGIFLDLNNPLTGWGFCPLVIRTVVRLLIFLCCLFSLCPSSFLSTINKEQFSKRKNDTLDPEL